MMSSALALMLKPIGQLTTQEVQLVQGIGSSLTDLLLTGIIFRVYDGLENSLTERVDI